MEYISYSLTITTSMIFIGEPSHMEYILSPDNNNIYDIYWRTITYRIYIVVNLCLNDVEG